MVWSSLIIFFFFRSMVVSEICHNDYEEAAGKSRRRFFLILQVFNIISDADDESVQKGEAVKLFFRAIPDALLTKVEMISTLARFTRGR